MTVKVVLKTTKFGSFSLGHSGPCDRETYEAVEWNPSNRISPSVVTPKLIIHTYCEVIHKPRRFGRGLTINHEDLEGVRGVRQKFTLQDK